MKTYIIGRGSDSHILLSDERVSRRHALLRVYPFGKMELVDMSQNGTFVNGMKVPANTPFPIRRKDVVIFAHAEKLNWKNVPNPQKTVALIAGGVLILALIVIGVVLLTRPSSGVWDKTDNSTQIETPADSSKRVHKDVKERESEDSVKGTRRKFVFPQSKPAVQAKPVTPPAPSNKIEKKQTPSTNSKKTQTPKQSGETTKENTPRVIM